MWRAPRKLRPASAGTRASASPPTAAPLSRGWAPGEKLPRQRPNQSAEMSRMWPHRGTGRASRGTRCEQHGVAKAPDQGARDAGVGQDRRVPR